MKRHTLTRTLVGGMAALALAVAALAGQPTGAAAAAGPDLAITPLSALLFENGEFHVGTTVTNVGAYATFGGTLTMKVAGSADRVVALPQLAPGQSTTYKFAYNNPLNPTTALPAGSHTFCAVVELGPTTVPEANPRDNTSCALLHVPPVPARR